MRERAIATAYLSPVRLAKPSDLDAVMEIEHAVFPKGVAESRRTYQDRLATFNEGFLIYRDNGKIKGFVTTEKWPSLKSFKLNRPASKVHDPEGKILHITALAVHPLHQMKGIGTKLLQTLLDTARRHKCTKAILLTRAQAEKKKPFADKFLFYEKFGFKRARVLPAFFSPAGRKRIDGIVLELDLRPGSAIKDKIPKQLDASKLMQRLADFMHGIRKEDKIALVHHQDADGLTSACILNRAIEKLRGRPADLEIPSGYSDWQVRNEVIPKLYHHGIQKVFVSDIGIDANPILIEEGPKHIEYAVFDHHKIYRDLNSDRVIFIKAQYLSSLDGSKYPAAKLVYDVINPIVDVREMDWVSAIGVLADMGLDTWNQFIQDTCLRNKVPLEKLMELKELISAVESLAPAHFRALFAHFYRSRNWREALKTPLMKYKKRLHHEVSKFCNSVYKHAEFIPELDLIFYEIKSRYEIKSALVNKLSTEFFPKQTLILIQDKGDKMLRFSGRRQDFKVKVNDLLEEAVQGLELGSAGGHIPAAAGRIACTELDSFKANVLRILLRQYFKSFRIRRVKPHELDTVLLIEHKVFRKEFWGFAPVYASRLKLFPQGFFAAEINNKLVGYCSSERWAKENSYVINQDPVNTHDPKGNILYLSAIGVISAFHAKGIGTALLREVIAFGRKQGCKRVIIRIEADNVPAANLFARFGFKARKRLKKMFLFGRGKNKKPVDGMVLELRLKS